MKNTTSTTEYHEDTKDLLITLGILAALFILWIFCRNSEKDEIDFKNRAARAQARIEARNMV
jgi:hypothetical protein